MLPNHSLSTMTRDKDVREEQTMYLQSNPNPRPLNFYIRYKYRKKFAAHRDYRLRLNDALAWECRSNKLLELKKKWETGEYDNDWSEYLERKADHKADVSFLLFIPWRHKA